MTDDSQLALDAFFLVKTTAAHVNQCLCWLAPERHIVRGFFKRFFKVKCYDVIRVPSYYTVRYVRVKCEQVSERRFTLYEAVLTAVY